MTHPKSIIYDNRTFSLGSKKTYYFARVKGKSESLHRYKYMKEKGDIPEGWHVHHKDGDCYNNNIVNLEAISPEEHFKLHPTPPEVLLKWQSAGIKVAPKWHASKEGKEWHKLNYERNKSILHEKIKRSCCNCGNPVLTNKKNSNYYCSNNCKSAWRRKNKPDKKSARCLKCGSEFETLKYLPAKYCSRGCRPKTGPKSRVHL